MRRLVASAVVPLTALALAVPTSASALAVGAHHKPGHERGPGAPDDGEVEAPVLKVSDSRVAPRTTVTLTAGAGEPVVGGTWKVRSEDGDWRELDTWSDADSNARSVTQDVASPARATVRYFKVVLRFASGGSASSNRVAVRTLVDREPSLPDPVNADGFKAVTWNVYYGTPVDQLRPILRRLLADNVSIFLMQEMSNPDVRRMFEEEGLEVHYVGYQWVIAWNPNAWTAAELQAKRLSSTSFTREDGTGPVYVDSALGVLRDEAGRTVEVMSYHLPPNAQVANPQPERLRIDRQAAETWRRLVDASTADAMLFGGDDNVDETNGYLSGTSFWDFLRRPATGLRQVQAPTGTISRYRRIDDFRIRGLEPGAGYTGDGGGDHKFFVSRFTWR